MKGPTHEDSGPGMVDLKLDRAVQALKLSPHEQLLAALGLRTLNPAS